MQPYKFYSAVIDVLSSSAIVWAEIRGKLSKLLHWGAPLSFQQT